MMMKLNSRIGDRYRTILNGRGACGRKDEMVRLVIRSRPRMRKAHARIAQGNPILGIKCVTMIGKMTPPRDEPAMVNPPAMALFLRK
jgi:hypothetical protein